MKCQDSQNNGKYFNTFKLKKRLGIINNLHSIKAKLFSLHNAKLHYVSDGGSEKLMMNSIIDRHGFPDDKTPLLK